MAAVGQIRPDMGLSLLCPGGKEQGRAETGQRGGLYVSSSEMEKTEEEEEE